MTHEEEYDELETWGLRMCEALVRKVPGEETPTLHQLSDVVGMKLRLAQHFGNRDGREVLIVTISGVRVRKVRGVNALVFSFPAQTTDYAGLGLQEMLGLACTFSGEPEGLRMLVTRYHRVTYETSTKCGVEDSKGETLSLHILA